MKSMRTKIGFICSRTNPIVFSENIERSFAWLSNDHIVVSGKRYPNLCDAYNIGIKRSSNDILIFVHQDVYLPDNWFGLFKKALRRLKDIDWGVLGVAGVGFGGRNYVGYLCDRGKQWKKGWYNSLPKQVQTVDELLFVIKNDGFFVFDEKIMSTDLHALDLCMQAREQGKENYVINAYLYHNSSRNSMVPLSKDFHKSSKYLTRKWRKFLPIDTTYATLKGN